MKKTLMALAIMGLSFSALAEVKDCPTPWVCYAFKHKIAGRAQKPLSLRAGYIDADRKVAFKGNIIFYQGLADSMINHLPLFSTLSREGYRVISFDYMGQGGSEGDMDNTRIQDIVYLGNRVWNQYARDKEKFPRKTIIGWSTGGLATYMAADQGYADRVVLLAPGISPKVVLSITEKSLTSERYKNGKAVSDGTANPHLDPIWPTSPVLVHNFALNLMGTAKLSHKWKISERVKGLVLLSGDEDKYVNGEDTETIINNNSNFQTFTYPGSLHELDNETATIRHQVYADILDFLRRN